MLVGNRCCFAAPWIHHHQFTAALLDGFQAFFHIRYGHDAAVGGQRVAAEDQHKVGVVDVRNRNQQAMAVHQVACQVMRQLIDRGGGIAVAGFQLAKEVVAVGHQAVVMHTRIALIHRHGVLPVPRLQLTQARGH